MAGSRSPEFSRDGPRWTVRDRRLERNFFALFGLSLVIAVVIPGSFAFAYWGGSVGDFLAGVLPVLVLLQASAWFIGFTGVRGTGYVELDRGAGTVTTGCAVPLFGLLRRRRRHRISEVRGLTYEQRNTKKGPAWFLYLKRKAGPPEMILGPIDDEGAVVAVVEEMNGVFRPAR